MKKQRSKISGCCYFFLLILSGTVLCAAEADSESSTQRHIDYEDDAFLKQRKKLRHRKRRIILNNDGCDCLYFPDDLEITPENFLAQRTSPLVNSHVDTIFYCSISSGFSNFTHNTQKGHILTRQVGEELNVSGKKNITQSLINQGTDPLKLVLNWCRKNSVECFWSFRMNDTHDGAHRPDKEYPLFPELKKEHPEYMIGKYRKRPKHGSWTSVNYALPEIRELAFKYIEEVCRNYDVDGIEMDFCRHLSYFRSVASGGVATDAELGMMTDLLKRVRAMTDLEGRKRGRPILIATRVPDSVEYCRSVGLDLEQWLEKDLVDLVVGGFYMQLNPFTYLAELGRKHDVAVYAGLSESRVRTTSEPFNRNSPESYRGRAMQAWQAGVDGIYLFNWFNPDAGFLREIGEEGRLNALDKVYFATIRNRNPNSYLADGKRFQNVPILTPENPMGIKAGETKTISFAVGDDFAKKKGAGQKGTVQKGNVPEVKLHLQISGEAEMSVKFNGGLLPRPERSDNWVVYPVDPDLVKPGKNNVEITTLPIKTPQIKKSEWNVIYRGTEKPAAPWSSDRLRDNLICTTSKDKSLLIADRGKKSGDYFYFSYPWNVDPEKETIVEARVKVVSGWNNIIVANGQAYDRVSLYPDRVSLYESRTIQHKMNTTDKFHTYRIVIKGRDILVFVDGKLALDGTGRFTKQLPRRNDIRFGAANSPGVGEACWQSVKLRFQNVFVTLYDLVLSVRVLPEGPVAKGYDSRIDLK